MKMPEPVGVRKSFALLLLVAVAGLTPGRVRAENDEVREEGRSAVVKGTVLKDNLGNVVVKITGGPEFPLRGKVEIAWDTDDNNWKTGLRQAKDGDYKEAADSFRQVYEDLDAFRAAARPELLLRYGEALRKSGQAEDALKVLSKLVDGYPESRHFPRAMELAVDLSLLTKNFNRAAQLVEKLKTLNKDKALLAQGELLMAREETAKAEQVFNEAAQSKDVGLASAARMGLARCALAKGNLPQARQIAEQALAASSVPGVAAGAYLIIGRALVEEAAKAPGEESKDKLRDAALAFLRVPLLYKDDRYAPEALFRAGECFRALSKKPGLEDNAKRATVMFGEVKDRYPGTLWASEADKSLRTR